MRDEDQDQGMGELLLAAGLTHLREQQRPIMVKLNHYECTPDNLARYGNALAIEVGEFVNETPWKPWKQKAPDMGKLREEFADVLAFIGTWVNLLGMMGVTPAEIAAAYTAKTAVNHNRLDGGVEHYGTPATGYAPAMAVSALTPDEVELIDGMRKTKAAEPPRRLVLDPQDEDDDDDDGTALGGEDEGDDPMRPQ